MPLRDLTFEDARKRIDLDLDALSEIPLDPPQEGQNLLTLLENLPILHSAVPKKPRNILDLTALVRREENTDKKLRAVWQHAVSMSDLLKSQKAQLLQRWPIATRRGLTGLTVSDRCVPMQK